VTNEPPALGDDDIAARFHVVSDLGEHLITGFVLSRIDGTRQMAGIWPSLPVCFL
jgi:hypothetical protein